MASPHLCGVLASPRSLAIKTKLFYKQEDKIIGYAILRFLKKTSCNLLSTQKHNEREKQSYKSNPDIDKEKSVGNIHLKAPSQKSYKAMVQARLQQVECKTVIKKNSIWAVETLITASPEFLQEMNHEQMLAYMRRAYDFMAERVVEDNILSAVIHLDEKTPHMHLCFVPLSKDNRLTAKEVIGNQARLSEFWQDGFHEYMSQQYPDLLRGKSAKITHRKHIPVALFKRGERLDKKYDAVEAILSNIGILNAKGKAEEALTLLKEWAKDGEYFCSQLKQTEGYITSLEGQVKELEDKVSSEMRYAHKFSEYNKQANRKIEDLQYDVSVLQRQKERYEALFSKLPPEIQQQLLGGGSRNRGRESER